MSQQDLQAFMQKVATDAAFATQIFRDFDGTLASSGYSLTPEEIQQAQANLSGEPPSADETVIPLSTMQDTFKQQQIEMRKRSQAQSERDIDLNKFTAQMLKETVGHSAATYKKITTMNQVMFWMGVGLFAFSVIYAAIFRNLEYSAAFAGLGAASFVGFFLLGPIQKTQAALSHLIGAEIAFMNYFEQMNLIEMYAMMPRDDAPGLFDPSRIERASEMLQERSKQTIELLHRYLEVPEEATSEPDTSTGRVPATS